jgi:hypothetical protein
VDTGSIPIIVFPIARAEIPRGAIQLGLRQMKIGAHDTQRNFLPNDFGHTSICDKKSVEFITLVRKTVLNFRGG